jgi:type I restriction enzyme R subunit
MSRKARVAATHATIYALLNEKQKDFIESVLNKYFETVVDAVDQ